MSAIQGAAWSAGREAPERASGYVAQLLEAAGVRRDGGRTWDPQIRDRRVYRRILAHGSLGLGESYVDGWWECERLDELVFRVLRAGIDAGLTAARSDLWRFARSCLWNLQTIAR